MFVRIRARNAAVGRLVGCGRAVVAVVAALSLLAPIDPLPLLLQHQQRLRNIFF